jgi:hypothetical protein
MATAYEPQPQDEPVDGGAMSDTELAAHLEEHEKRAIGYYESEIASEQANALDRYYRRPYGDEQAGRSKVVDATVAITVDNAVAAILKPFVSQDDVVAFEPKRAEQEDQAKQATEYANYVFYNDNPGFTILHDWFKDALLQKLGVVKVYWEDYTREKSTRADNLTSLEIQSLEAEGVIEAVYGPNEYGLYTVDIRETEQDGKLCVENVPPEEYRVSPYARPGRVPPYEAHKTTKSRSELVEMGFDREVVDSLSKYSANAFDDQRSISRYQDEDWGSSRTDAPGDKSRDLVAFNDELVLIDYNGDGVSELRRVMRSGNTILYNEEAEFGCFARLCPVPMPHKLYGLSLADQVIDEQRIATVLWRQTLDNLYLANNPRLMVPQTAERSTDGSGSVTIDDLLDDSPGAIVRTGIDPIVPLAIPFVADKSFPMLDYVQQQADSRSGIQRQGQGMDPEAVDRSGQITATQAAIMEDGRNARAELIARIFAETGIKDLFKLILKNLVTHQPRSRVIRLRNEWVEMDPRSWNADMDLSIAVGLGMGNKAEQIAVADGVLETMAAIGQTPFSSLVDKEKVYNAVKRKFSAAGIKNIDDFLVEPERDEEGNVVPEQPQPDPEMMKAQAELQMQQAKMQGEQQMAQAKLEFQKEEAAMKIQLQREEAAAELELAQAKAAAEMQLAREKMAFEQEQAREQMGFEQQLAAHQQAAADHHSERDMERRDREADGKLSKNRPGGKLDQ